MKKYRISEHINEIRTNIISNIIWYVLSFFAGNVFLLMPFLQGVYKSIVSNSYNIPIYAYVLLGVTILLWISIIILLLVLLNKFEVDKNDDNDQPLEETQQEQDVFSGLSVDYKFTSIVAEMTFDDNRKDIKSTIDYKMKVLAEEVSELKRELIWSGSSYKGTKLIQMNGNYEVEETKRTCSPYLYTIKFNNKKKRGDTVEFKTETSVQDEDFSMLPVYSFMVKYQIDLLKLHIIAPKGMLKNVKKVVYADSAREICVEKPRDICKENIRDLVRYTFEIPNPSLLYNYFIEWEFTS